MSDFDLFGEPIIKDELLRDRFLEPPFTILDTKGGEWLKRKQAWKRLGIESEQGRAVGTLKNGFNFEKYGRTGNTSSEGEGTSIFDPALCELMYRWFCLPGGKILDPFAGGSVRGIVANYLGYKYTGIELRPEQVDSNMAQGMRILPGNVPQWITGDSEIVLEKTLQCNPMYDELYDLVFTCPPYHDLEVYSDLPDDLSNMPYDYFMCKMRSIIRNSIMMLKQNSFAIFIVGDIRDKDGFYRNFNGDIKRAFIDAGAKLYNEAKLLQPLGTAMLRANKTFGTGKKLVKVHEDVLIFYKGDPKMIKQKFNE